MRFQKRVSPNGFHPASILRISLCTVSATSRMPRRKECLLRSREILLEVRGYPDYRRPGNSWKVERVQANFRIWQSAEDTERGLSQNGPRF